MSNNSAEKPTIVMIPGLGSDKAVWQLTIDEMDGAFYFHVGDTLSDASLAQMADRILSQVKGRFALAGVSMGGMVALEMMRRAPERVSHLVLLDTNPSPDTVEQRARRQAANTALENATVTVDQIRANISFMLDKSASSDVHKRMLDMSERLGAEPYIRQNKAVMDRDDQRPILPTIAVPTLIIYGESDRITPVELGRQLATTIRDSVLHVIPDCGHLPPIEKPAIVAGLIRDFVKC